VLPGIWAIVPSSLACGSDQRSKEPSEDGPAAILAIMSTAEEWDCTVPDDDAEPLAELRRRGVRPGRRLHRQRW